MGSASKIIHCGPGPVVSAIVRVFDPFFCFQAATRACRNGNQDAAGTVGPLLPRMLLDKNVQVKSPDIPDSGAESTPARPSYPSFPALLPSRSGFLAASRSRSCRRRRRRRTPLPHDSPSMREEQHQGRYSSSSPHPPPAILFFAHDPSHAVLYVTATTPPPVSIRPLTQRWGP